MPGANIGGYVFNDSGVIVDDPRMATDLLSRMSMVRRILLAILEDCDFENVLSSC